jgi:hypothetical protein
MGSKKVWLIESGSPARREIEIAHCLLEFASSNRRNPLAVGHQAVFWKMALREVAVELGLRVAPRTV